MTLDAPSLPDLSRRVAAIANRTLARARDAGRGDLAERIETEAARWGQQDASVVVVGGSRSGKTALVNALCGRAILPVGEGSTGQVLIRSGPEPLLLAHRDHEDEPLELDPAALSEWLGTPNVVLDVQVADGLLPTGLVLLDTPAIDALDQRRRDRALEALQYADAVVLCLPAAGPLTSAELAVIDRITERVEDVMIAVTRIDRFRGYQALIDDSTRILREQPLASQPSLHAVSARLALTATEDPSLDADTRQLLLDESGIDELRAEIVTRVGSQVESIRLANLIRICTTVTQQLRSVEQATHDSLADTAGMASMTDLHDAQAELEALSRDSSRWTVEFNDRMAMLRESLATEINRAASTILDDIIERVEAGSLTSGDAAAELLDRLDEAEAELDSRCQSDARDLVDLAVAAVHGQRVMETSLDELLGPHRSVSLDPVAPRKKARDLGSLTRVGAMIATSSSGLAMMAMSLQSSGAGSGMQVARGMAFGIAALMGTASGTVTMRQGKRQKMTQEVRVDGRRVVDDWRTAVSSRVRRILLLTQREAERDLKELILDRKRSIEETIKARQLAAKADVADRKALLGESTQRLDRIIALADDLAALNADVAAFRHRRSSSVETT
jgi:hypothetical protein